MALLALAFIVIPLVDLWLLLVIGGQIGFWPTVALTVGTALVGSYLAKREGRRVLREWSAALAEARMPGEGLLSGALVLVGGALLITPGVLTDLAGLALLFPPSRRLVAALVRERLERRLTSATRSAGAVSWDFRVIDLGAVDPSGPDREIIDVEAEVVDVPEPRRLPQGHPR